jgi:hypothetical protein
VWLFASEKFTNGNNTSKLRRFISVLQVNSISDKVWMENLVARGKWCEGWKPVEVIRGDFCEFSVLSGDFHEIEVTVCGELVKRI